MTRFVVIGDTGGNANVLSDCLARAGVADGKVPTDTVVLHVGDFVRCHAQFKDGNRESLELIAELLLENPESYVQLLGNHESAFLGGPRRPGWRVDASIDSTSATTLHDLWSTQRIQLAHAVVSAEHGPILVTHAGLTRHRWQDLGMPPTPEVAAALVNRDVGQDLARWSRAGLLVGAEDDRSDTTWAEVNLEYYEPWIAHGDAPFAQIHGHASPYNWQTNEWWPDAPMAVRAATTVDADTRRTATTLSPGATSMSVDWNLGDEPLAEAPDWDLLTLDVREAS